MIHNFLDFPVLCSASAESANPRATLPVGTRKGCSYDGRHTHPPARFRSLLSICDIYGRETWSMTSNRMLSFVA